MDCRLNFVNYSIVAKHLYFYNLARYINPNNSFSFMLCYNFIISILKLQFHLNIIHLNLNSIKISYCNCIVFIIIMPPYKYLKYHHCHNYQAFLIKFCYFI